MPFLSSRPHHKSHPASGASSVGPHAVSAAGSFSYTYDNNGNTLTGSGETLSYDKIGRRLSVETASRRRWCMTGMGGWVGEENRQRHHHHLHRQAV